MTTTKLHPPGSTPLVRTRFCPGNCTAYDIIYGTAPGGGYLLVWLSRGGSGGSAFRFDDGIFIHSGYLMEKMDLRFKGDALALCAFLNAHGHHAEVGQHWTLDGNYDPKGGEE